MNKIQFSRAVGNTSLRLKKHAPTILFAAGVTGTVATVVVACRATLKAQKINEVHKDQVTKADLRLENQYDREFDKETHKKHVIGIWTATSVGYLKVYGPAFVLGVTSIACLTKSHQILSNRNSALMAAYAGVDAAFKGYRKRVVEELGEEKDTEFAHGKEDGVYTDYDKKGNAVVKETKRASVDAKTAYGRWFDETNRHWDKDPGYNHTFLDNQQKWANVLLKKNGHIFLNEVYDLIGIERTEEGQQVGWIYESTEGGDGYVDFGFIRYPDFVAGFERSVFLDFNVDGVIVDLFNKPKK